MAALIIAAGFAIADKIEKKKQLKKEKKANTELRYKELEVETKRRLSRTQSGTIIEHTPADDEDTASQAEDERSPSPPSYEAVVEAGTEKERDRQQHQRRRSSAYSAHGATNYIRMG